MFLGRRKKHTISPKNHRNIDGIFIKLNFRNIYTSIAFKIEGNWWKIYAMIYDLNEQNLECTPHSEDDSEKKKDGRREMSEFAYIFTIAANMRLKCHFELVVVVESFVTPRLWCHLCA